MRYRIVWSGVMLLASLWGCSSESSGPVAEPAAVDPLAGFASDTVFVVASEQTPDSLALLSLDPATGELGLLPGSTANVGVGITDAETLAADSAARRIFFGSNLDGAIAVVDVDATGRPVPVAGSPFTAERTQVSVIKISPTGSTIYVGYHGESVVSRYDVSATGALTLAQTISTGANSHVETMIVVGDVLYVGFATPGTIVGYRLDGVEAFATTGPGDPVVVTEIVSNSRPDYLVTTSGRLYCSLASNGSVDAFTIEADGSLTRLAGAPYTFPGMGGFELIAVQPGGRFLAVGGELPSATVGLYTIEADGSLTPNGPPLVMHPLKGGPEGLTFSPDGRFLYVCDHVGQGLYVFEVTGGSVVRDQGALDFAATPRYELPGRQIDILRLAWTVAP